MADRYELMSVLCESLAPIVITMVESENATMTVKNWSHKSSAGAATLGHRDNASCGKAHSHFDYSLPKRCKSCSSAEHFWNACPRSQESKCDLCRCASHTTELCHYVPVGEDYIKVSGCLKERAKDMKQMNIWSDLTGETFGGCYEDVFDCWRFIYYRGTTSSILPSYLTFSHGGGLSGYR